MFLQGGQVKLWKFNRDLTIKTQILIISLFFSILILGILLGAVLWSQRFITDAICVASNKIFTVQTKAYMNIVWLHEYKMEEQIASTMQHLATIRKLHNLVQQNEGQILIQEPKMCLLNEKERDSYSIFNSVCCGVFGTPLNQELENELKNVRITASLVDVLRPEYDFSQFSPIAFQYNNSAQFYCFSFGLAFPSKFKPQQRSYYIETLEQMKNLSNPDPQAFYFTKPFNTLLHHIRCPMTTALLDLNHQFVGLIEKDIDFDYSYIQKPLLKTITNYVLAQDGLVVYTELYKISTQPAFYLNESKYSGFNEQDYQQIMFKHYGKPFQSNCLNFNFVDILCRYNELTQDNVIIRSANISGSPYIMLILSDTNKIKQEESDHISFLNHELTAIVRKIIYSLTYASIGSIVIGYWSLSVILRQLNNIIYKINKLIHQNRFNLLHQRNFKQYLNHPIWNTRNSQRLQIFQLFKFGFFQSNLIKHLTRTIVKLFYFINNEKKCSECKRQEIIKYPKIQPVQNRNLFGIRLAKGDLKNFKNIPKELIRKLTLMIKNNSKKY